jgi:Zn-dependent protease with chaperone function
MTPAWIVAVVGGAAFALTNAGVALLAWATWPCVRRAFAARPAAVRARVAFVWRVSPAVHAAVLTTIVVAAFLAHEPAGRVEPVGMLLPLCAAVGAGLACLAVFRAATTLVLSEWLAYSLTRAGGAVELPGAGVRAWPVDSDFPIVAVVGAHRPRLIVARTVVDRCTPGELAAIAAHERGHLEARDNLRRWCLQGACDVLSWTRRSREMAAVWQEAAEDAADDYATVVGARALDLASALVTVARLAHGQRLTPMPAIAFYRGDGVERRVRRLLAAGDSAPAAGPRRASRRVGAGTALLAACLFLAMASRDLHQVAEWIVTNMP